jgi:hypothetical protein
MPDAFRFGFMGAFMYDLAKELPQFKDIMDEMKKNVRVCLEKSNQDSAKTAENHKNKNTSRDAPNVANVEEKRRRPRQKSGRKLRE